MEQVRPRLEAFAAARCSGTVADLATHADVVDSWGSTQGLARRLRPSAGKVTGHWRAISRGVVGSMTVTSGASVAQVRAVRGPDRSDSQADSAGSIPVTRSNPSTQVSDHISGRVPI